MSTSKKQSSSKKSIRKKRSAKSETSRAPVPTFLPSPLVLNNPAAPTADQQLQIDKLFAQALSRYKNENLVDKQAKLKEVNHLAIMAEEYLSTFALIGYSLQNEKVVIFNMPTSKDEAALVDLIRSTFIELVNNRP